MALIKTLDTGLIVRADDRRDNTGLD